MKLAYIVVLTGLIGVAEAQTMTFSWSATDTGNGDGIVEPGENAILLLSAVMDPGEIGFAGSIFEIMGNIHWQAGTVVRYDNLLDDLTDDGTLGAGNHITGIEAFQLPPVFNENFVADNPITLYEIEFALVEYFLGTVTFTTANHLNADVYVDDTGTSVAYDPVITGGSFDVLPAPASAALLSLASIVGSRRRRRT